MRPVIAALLLVCIAAPAQAFILWEQLPVFGLTAYIDQEFPDDQEFSTYQVHDVTVGAGGWVVTSLSTFFTAGNPNWPMGSVTARLNVFSKSGSLPAPGDDPMLGVVHSAVISQVDPLVNLLTVTGLDIALGPGSYWFGLTPNIQFNGPGQEFHLVSTPPVGDFTAIRNPGGGFQWGTGWTGYESLFRGTPGDGAIRIEGRMGEGPVVPEPCSLALLSMGFTAGVVLIQRRK